MKHQKSMSSRAGGNRKSISDIESVSMQARGIIGGGRSRPSPSKRTDDEWKQLASAMDKRGGVVRSVVHRGMIAKLGASILC